MIFTTMTFVIFLVPVCVLYWIIPAGFRRVFLIMASLAFYLYNQPGFLALIVVLSLVTLVAGKVLCACRERKDAKFIFPDKMWWLIGIGVSIAALCYFKYARFLAGTFNDLCHLVLNSRPLSMPLLLAPLGISFFVLEFIHYLTDVYHGRIKRHSVVDFGLFAVFFPTMVCGPIKRFQPFQEQEHQIGDFNIVYLHEGMKRMLMGCVQKFVIADSLTPLANLLQSPHDATRAGLWVAIYAYSFKIYFDFAGYSDIAIGAARLFGYRVPENFNWPYLRSNISDFWKSWHMSLSSWIKDYLFIPLGGSRRPMPRVILNLALVMAVCGLWHGANYTCIAWGLWHGIGLGAHHFYKSKQKPDAKTGLAGRLIGTVITFHYVLIGWVFFAASNLKDAGIILWNMVF